MVQQLQQGGYSHNSSSSSNSHLSFLSDIYLDPSSIPESPTISPDLIDSPTIPITSREQGEELLRQLSRESNSNSTSNSDDYEYEYEYSDINSEDYQVCLRSNTLKHHIPISLSNGNTKPLRVRKKKGVTAVKVGSKTKKRRSTLSFPSSPLSRSSFSPNQLNSPRFVSNMNYNMNGPKRNPSSNSTKSNLSKTHANISNLFLSLPTTSPSPISEQSFRLKMKRGDKNLVKQRKERITSESSLHLNLGKFNDYDQSIIPGPSPPISPIPSPTKRIFTTTITTPNDMEIEKYKKKAFPPSPLTPSRAPRKAVALLGTGPTTHKSSSIQGKTQNTKKVHGLNTKHFRPLPNSTLNEIEKFFGDIPKKPSKTSSSSALKQNSNKSKSSSSTGVGINDKLVGDRNIGSGETCQYKGEDGSMWLDVEEEQEFAWLLSEIFALIPQPLPDLTKIKSNEGFSTQNVEEEEINWEMENFTSILSLPKPKKVSPTTGIKDIRTNKSKKDKNQLEDSFLNLETPKPSTSRTFTKNIQIHPWSQPPSEVKPQHKRSLSNPISPSLSSLDKSIISSPIPALIPPPRISSKKEFTSSSFPGSTSLKSTFDCSSGSGSGSGSDSDLSSSPTSSPPRIKNRPPPLTLKRIKPSGKLPILTATTPNHQRVDSVQLAKSKSQSQSQPVVPQVTVNQREHKYDAPNTPFVRPRAAPKPTISIEEIPPLPPIKSTYQIKQSEQNNEQPISFLEPITPTESISLAHDRLRSKVTTNNGTGNKEKTSWLKRVVRRPLGGDIKV